MTDSPDSKGVDIDGLVAWLAEVVDPSISSATVTKLAGGHSSGAWRIDVSGTGLHLALVLKAPEGPSVVYRRDVCQEGRVLDALNRAGAPVPVVVAIDAVEQAIGRPCFVMELVEGRSPADSSVAGYHDDPWLHEVGPVAQRAMWSSFYDSLAALHTVDAAQLTDASHGQNGSVDVIGYWRESLLDVAPAETVPRQVAVLDWLVANLPADADDCPALCMGDARFVNCLIDGAEVRALIDFEVAYLGNPAADIGYSTFLEAQQLQNAQHPLPGIGGADEAWSRWATATGRDATHRHYWTAFGAMVIVITASRAMVQWGLAGPSLDSDNPLVAVWEDLAARAAGQ